MLAVNGLSSIAALDSVYSKWKVIKERLENIKQDDHSLCTAFSGAVTSQDDDMHCSSLPQYGQLTIMYMCECVYVHVRMYNCLCVSVHNCVGSGICRKKFMVQHFGSQAGSKPEIIGLCEQWGGKNHQSLALGN